MSPLALQVSVTRECLYSRAGFFCSLFVTFLYLNLFPFVMITVQLDNVGDVIEKIRIGHDNKGMTPGWHLDKVEVRRLKEDGETSTTYTFPCNRWLAKDEDDGSVVRELVPHKVIEESVTEDGEVETKEVAQETLERKYARVNGYRQLPHSWLNF